MESPDTAAALLHEAQRVQDRVLQQGPRDWLIEVSWALWVLAFIPPFDVVRDDVWGPVVGVSSVVGTILTYRYYAIRHRRVHPLSPTRWQVWFVWAAWYGGWIGFAEVWHTRLDGTWTVAALAAAAPLLAHAWRARARVRVAAMGRTR
jgi:hypothetical protein